MSEAYYWIWSNKDEGWRMAHQQGHTRRLHEAGRYVEHVAHQLVRAGNEGLSNVEYPNLVLVEANNTYLTPQAQEIYAQYQLKGMSSMNIGKERRVVEVEDPGATPAMPEPVVPAAPPAEAPVDAPAEEPVGV